MILIDEKYNSTRVLCVCCVYVMCLVHACLGLVEYVFVPGPNTLKMCSQAHKSYPLTMIASAEFHNLQTTLFSLVFRREISSL